MEIVQLVAIVSGVGAINISMMIYRRNRQQHRAAEIAAGPLRPNGRRTAARRAPSNSTFDRRTYDQRRPAHGPFDR